MQSFTKIISVIIVVCFSFTNIVYPADINSFKLSPPSSFSSLKGPEFKESAQVLIGVLGALDELPTGLSLDSIKKLGTRRFEENTIFSSRVVGKLIFNEADECVVSGKNITLEAGSYLIKAEVDSKAYYCLISKGEGNKKYAITVVPERVITEALAKGTVKFTHSSMNENDQRLINAYLDHEIITEISISIDYWISDEMIAGRYAVDHFTARNSSLYRHGERAVYSKDGYTNILAHIDTFLRKLGVSTENRGKISDIMTRKPLIFIPYVSELELPLINVCGQSVRVTAHSSQYATYIFVPGSIYQNITSGDFQWNKAAIEYVTANLVHEIGAICGKGVVVKDGHISNILDKYYAAYPATLQPDLDSFKCATEDKEEISNLAPVNLLDLELRNDYAAGVTPEKRSIFRRIMLPIIVAAVAVGAFFAPRLFHNKTSTTPKNEPLRSTHATDAQKPAKASEGTDKWGISDTLASYINLSFSVEVLTSAQDEYGRVVSLWHILNLATRRAARSEDIQATVIPALNKLLKSEKDPMVLKEAGDVLRMIQDKMDGKRPVKDPPVLKRMVKLLNTIQQYTTPDKVDALQQHIIQEIWSMARYNNTRISPETQRTLVIPALEQIMKNTEKDSSTYSHAEEALKYLKRELAVMQNVELEDMNDNEPAIEDPGSYDGLKFLDLLRDFRYLVNTAPTAWDNIEYIKSFIGMANRSDMPIADIKNELIPALEYTNKSAENKYLRSYAATALKIIDKIIVKRPVSDNVLNLFLDLNELMWLIDNDPASSDSLGYIDEFVRMADRNDISISDVKGEVIPALKYTIKNAADKGLRSYAATALKKVQKIIGRAKYEKRMGRNAGKKQASTTLGAKELPTEVAGILSGRAVSRLTEIDRILWDASLGYIPTKEAMIKLAAVAPIPGTNPKERDEVYAALLAQAKAAMFTLAVKRTPRNEAPTDEEIKALAAKIKDMEIEVFIHKSQLPDDKQSSFRKSVEAIFGDRLRVYQDVDQLTSMIKNPQRSIVMTVDLTDEQIGRLEGVKDSLGQTRFMNFEHMDIDTMSTAEYENYFAEIVGILLAARSITPEEAGDKGSSAYRTLANLLEDRMEDPGEIDAYIRTVADNAQDTIVKLKYMLKTILKALPIEAYRVIRPILQVLWSA